MMLGTTNIKSRNTPSTTNLEEEEIVDALDNDGNSSMPEQVQRPNPWRMVMMMMLMMINIIQRQIQKVFNQGFIFAVLFCLQNKQGLYR